MNTSEEVFANISRWKQHPVDDDVATPGLIDEPYWSWIYASIGIFGICTNGFALVVLTTTKAIIKAALLIHFNRWVERFPVSV